jgi:uncharacterized protein YbjT (DUF2867 family)
MQGRPILVTGSTGTIGSEVVEQLLQRGRAVRVLTRDPAKAGKFGKGVEIAIGELGRPETLAPAFANVLSAFVLSSNQGGPNAAWEANAFEAAKSAGVEYIVKLSGRGADSYNAGSFIGEQQTQSEAELRASGVRWTILRPGFFASNFLNDFPVARLGTLALPTGAGRDCAIDPKDVAAVAVEVLTTVGHDGKIYELTGPDLLTYAEMVEAISTTINRPLRFVDVPPAEFRQAMLSFGAPEPVADALVQFFTAVKEGRMRPSPDFARLMGRPPRWFGDWVRDHAAAFAAQLPSAA